DSELAVLVHVDVGEVARVRTFGIVPAVLHAGRVVMAAGRLETRRLALAGLVDVKGMDTGREVLGLGEDPEALRDLGDGDSADLLAVRIDQHGVDALLRLRL